MKVLSTLATALASLSLSLAVGAQMPELAALPDPAVFRHQVAGGLHVVEMTANGATCRTGRPD